ncbi:hypothetical protein FHU39_003475 [Flexivirga oryzae]|uniref:Uncharacterized protein n=1 Tax=Flexivirga oryzae TaxID=1794944 RepID=A0A839NBU5_9MICO|nr:hypothetical protein [Flexivirga oryzae]
MGRGSRGPMTLVTRGVLDRDDGPLLAWRSGSVFVGEDL